MTGVGVMDLYSGEPQTRFKDNMPIYVIAICQYYNLDGAEVTTIESDWDFSVKFSAGTEVYLMPWSLQSLDLSGVQEGVVLPLEKVEEKPWEIIEFGEYPQSLKADNVSIVSQTPDADGYYLGDDGERYAKHTINLDSNELFWGEVPLYTLDGVLMENGETYYFKVEPIKWRVLKTENGESLIVADEILKGMQYLADESSHNGAPEGTHPNNYVYSDLRAFLTGEFYDVAFSDDEKTKIQTTLVDNSAETLLYEDFACDNTEDKVFALSYADTINEEYFFSTNSTGHVPDRFWRPSDYAVATGTFVNSGETIIGATFPYLIGSGDVWLRSPWGSDSQVSFVSGSSSDDGLYAEYYGGVAPAMRITR